MWETTHTYPPSMRRQLTGIDLVRLRALQKEPQFAMRRHSKARIAISVGILFLLGLAAGVLHGQTPSVLTKGDDVSRTSEWPYETVLTPAAVRARGMVKVTTIPCIGDARGCEAELVIDAGLPRPIMALASEANVVRGVDPATGAGIWQTPQLCTPVKNDATVDMWGTGDHTGIMSTPVIDPDTHKLYLIATCSPDGTPAKLTLHWYTLGLATGMVLSDSGPIQATYGNQVFGAIPRKQRSALLLAHFGPAKFVCAGFGSYSETGSNATGWVLCLDTLDNRTKLQWASTQGNGGGIWGSSQGLAQGANGDLYFATGNGAFNGVSDFGEAAVQLHATVPTAASPGKLEVVSAWSPFSDAARTGANPQLTQPVQKLPAGKVAGVSAPSEVK